MFQIQSGSITPFCVPLPCSARCIRGVLQNERSLLLWGQNSCWALNSVQEDLPAPFPLSRGYSAMCYDAAEDCFWAATFSQPDVLYKLSKSFEELSCIRIRAAGGHYVTGICCGESGRCLWLSYPSRIGCLNKEDNEIEWHTEANRSQSVCGILIHCGYQILAISRPCGLIIKVTSLCDGSSSEFSVPQEYSLLGILPCRRAFTPNHPSCCFSLLLRALCSGALAVMDCCISHGCCHPADEPATCCGNADVSPCSPQCECCPPPCPCPPPHPCPPCCTDKHGYYEIMHSIALEEAAIAHILNAEGEKLQKAVAQNITIEQLLCVNESVKQTITQVCILEGQLNSKLEALLNPCNGTRPSPIPNPCDCGCEE